MTTSHSMPKLNMPSTWQQASSVGLDLPIDQSSTGYHGVICNANAGKGRPPWKMPYQARVTDIEANIRIVHGLRFATAEEAALERAKLLKSNPNKYK